jgi:23S rRNA pseudouridine955/2504/2580 synthase
MKRQNGGPRSGAAKGGKGPAKGRSDGKRGFASRSRGDKNLNRSRSFDDKARKVNPVADDGLQEPWTVSEKRSAKPARTGNPQTDKPLGVRGHPDARRTETVQPEGAGELLTAVTLVTIGPDEAGMRIDRFLEARFVGLSFAHIQRIVRKGEVRLDGKRVDSKDRLSEGQVLRIPPVRVAAPERPGDAERDKTLAFFKDITLYEDPDVLIINKPMGLAVQGGSGTTRHVDGMLVALTDAKGQRPRLVHRLDKDTAGCLVIAKTRFAATQLTKSFRSRETRKIYWALVSGVPRTRQGRISTYIAREEQKDGDSRMRVVSHGDDGASHALTYYAVVETSARKVSWLSLKPVTGRTHQLRVHTAEIGHPILGDPKYFNRENWDLPGGIQNKLHLLARRIVIPHPRTGKPIDVSAPLPAHMEQSFNLLGLDAKRYDPIEDSPER